LLCFYESPRYELYDPEQGTFFTASSVDFVKDVFPGKDMVDELKDVLIHGEEEFVERGEDQDEKVDHGFTSEDSDEENEMAKN